MAYLAGCSLSSQSMLSILDLQAGTLSSYPSQDSSQSWELWSPGTNESEEFKSWVGDMLSRTKPAALFSLLD